MIGPEAMILVFWMLSFKPTFALSSFTFIKRLFTRLDAWDKRSDLVHWENLEGADGEGGGRGDLDGEHMKTHGCFISMYDKIHYK